LIKPHFNLDQIAKGFQELVELNVLRSSPSSNRAGTVTR
jgi:hypothetical protein